MAVHAAGVGHDRGLYETGPADLGPLRDLRLISPGLDAQVSLQPVPRDIQVGLASAQGQASLLGEQVRAVAGELAEFGYGGSFLLGRQRRPRQPRHSPGDPSRQKVVITDPGPSRHST